MVTLGSRATVADTIIRTAYADDNYFPFITQLGVKNKTQLEDAPSCTYIGRVYLVSDSGTFQVDGDLNFTKFTQIELNGCDLKVTGDIVVSGDDLCIYSEKTKQTITANKITVAGGVGLKIEGDKAKDVTVNAPVEITENGNSLSGNAFYAKRVIFDGGTKTVEGHFKELELVSGYPNNVTAETMIIHNAQGMRAAVLSDVGLVRLEGDFSMDDVVCMGYVGHWERLPNELECPLDLNGHTISGSDAEATLILIADDENTTVLKDTKGIGAITGPLRISKGKVDPSAQATVTFNPGYAKGSVNDKGNYPEQQTIVRGQKTTRPTDPLAQFDASADTQVLEGWRKQGDTALFNFNTAIMADTTLLAQWQSCIPVSSCDELKAALASGSSKAIFLTKDFPLTEDLTTSASTSIIMVQGCLTQSSHTLTVAAGHTLTLNASKETKFPLVVAGRLKAAEDGSFTTGESIAVESGGVIESGAFYGSVTVNEGGVIEGGIFYGKVTNHGTIRDSACAFITLNTDGGEPMEPTKVLRGQKPSEPGNAVKTGSIFVGSRMMLNMPSIPLFSRI